MASRSYDYRRYLVRHNRAMETGEPSVVETLEFHDKDLLSQAWKHSQYNKQKDKTISPENVRDDIISQAMCFQPASGFCGLASVNTVLQSLPTPYFVPYPERGRGYSMFSLAEYVILNCAPIPLTNVQALFMEQSTTLDQFRTILEKYANNPNHRLLSNFHRTPLFYSERSTEEEAYHRAFAGHWSPVGGLIHTPRGDYVLVLDTNPKYGPFMVSIDRFFLAVKTETLRDGFRGFLLVDT